jgi:hypothetical protein
MTYAAKLPRAVACDKPVFWAANRTFALTDEMIGAWYRHVAQTVVFLACSDVGLW